MIKAVNGCPIVLSQDFTSKGISPSLNMVLLRTVLLTINKMGMPIIEKIIPTEGNFSFFNFSRDQLRASTKILLAIYFPNTGPLMMAVGIPIINPNKITHPKSAFKISATATGPGVGGINACVIANPARSGIA